jgi:glycine cleavage system H lipoate-binding protein
MKQKPPVIPNRKTILYTENHTWVRVIDNATVTAGLTQHGRDLILKSSGSHLGVTYIHTEPTGTELKRMEPFGLVETMTTTFRLASPITGKIEEVNKKILWEQYLLNDDPISHRNPEETWIVKIKPTNLDKEIPLLLSPEQYREICSH